MMRELLLLVLLVLLVMMMPLLLVLLLGRRRICLLMVRLGDGGGGSGCRGGLLMMMMVLMLHGGVIQDLMMPLPSSLPSRDNLGVGRGCGGSGPGVGINLRGRLGLSPPLAAGEGGGCASVGVGGDGGGIGPHGGRLPPYGPQVPLELAYQVEALLGTSPAPSPRSGRSRSSSSCAVVGVAVAYPLSRGEVGDGAPTPHEGVVDLGTYPVLVLESSLGEYLELRQVDVGEYARGLAAEDVQHDVVVICFGGTESHHCLTGLLPLEADTAPIVVGLGGGRFRFSCFFRLCLGAGLSLGLDLLR